MLFFLSSRLPISFLLSPLLFCPPTSTCLTTLYYMIHFTLCARNYYEGINKSIPNDEYFKLMMQQAWQI